MSIQKIERLIGVAAEPKGKIDRLELSRKTFELIKNLADAEDKKKIELAKSLQEAVRKEYPSLKALELATEIDCYIRRLQPGVETIVLC
ncbi:MAG: hypothetical protein N3G80_00170 [Candidatus Micrarchaeota archaeon]|nr:hypothetical protein [Candidatus Micrarchaeota archaeon]